MADARHLGTRLVEYINLGRTNQWGYTDEPLEPDRLARYLWLPPCDQPDVNLVFGRFRVAVAATLYLHAAPGLRLVVGDMDRPHYAPISRLYRTVEQAGAAHLMERIEGLEAEAEAIAAAHRGDLR